MTGEQRDRRDDWPSEMRAPEPTTSSAPAGDTDAEVAAHRPCGCPLSRHRAHCADCNHSWPCLVRRLAEVARQRDGALARVRRRERIIESDERGIASRDEQIAALLAAGNALAEAVLSCRFPAGDTADEVDARAKVALDRWERALAPGGVQRGQRSELMAAVDQLAGAPTPVTPDGRCWYCSGGLGHGPDGHRPDCALAALRALAPGGAGEGVMREVEVALAAFRAEYERIDAAMTRYPDMSPPEQAAILRDIFAAFKSMPMLLDEVERLRAMRMGEA